jgi:hypothetical protein
LADAVVRKILNEGMRQCKTRRAGKPAVSGQPKQDQRELLAIQIMLLSSEPDKDVLRLSLRATGSAQSAAR